MPVHPSPGLADVDGEVGRALDLGDDAHRRHDLAEVGGDRRLEGQHPVAALLERQAGDVHGVVGDDHLLGAGEVLGQQDVGRPQDVLGDPSGEPGDLRADPVELGVELVAEWLRRRLGHHVALVTGHRLLRPASECLVGGPIPHGISLRRRTPGETTPARHPAVGCCSPPGHRGMVDAPCGSASSPPTTGSSSSSTPRRPTSLECGYRLRELLERGELRRCVDARCGRRLRAAGRRADPRRSCAASTRRSSRRSTVRTSTPSPRSSTTSSTTCSRSATGSSSATATWRRCRS